MSLLSTLSPNGWICQDVTFTRPAHIVSISNPYCQKSSGDNPCRSDHYVDEISYTETFSVMIKGGDSNSGDYNTADGMMDKFVASLPDQSQYQGYKIELGKGYTCGGLGTFWTRMFSTPIEMFLPKTGK